MTAPLALPAPKSPARREADAALGELSPQEALFAQAWASGLTPREAAAEANYAHPEVLGPRLRRRPRIVLAMKALVAARDEGATIDHAGACALLETALRTGLADLGEVADDGTLVGLRPLESLSPGQQLRIKKAVVRVHKSAQGERGSYRVVEIDFVPGTEILDRLARLRRWVDDSTKVTVEVAAKLQLSAVADAAAGWRVVAELAKTIFDGDEAAHARYLEAHVSGDTAEAARLVREEITRLREHRSAITIPTIPEETQQ